MSSENQIESVVNRRLLLRGGAVVAGATAAAAIAGVAAAPAAEAADGDELVVGASNQGAATTGLTLTPGKAGAATLALTNNAGPTLRLTPFTAEGNPLLLPGDILNTDEGPVVGVYYDGESTIDILATGRDLDAIPLPMPMDPFRLLDTRTAAGRERIVRKSSPGAIGSDGRLQGGAWIDVAITDTGSAYALYAIFANAAVVSPASNGFLVVYPATSTRPATSTINYQRGVNLANAVFVGPGTFDGSYIVRIYSSATSHILLDLSGTVASFIPIGDTDQTRTVRTVRTGRADRFTRKITRMRKTITTTP